MSHELAIIEQASPPDRRGEELPALVVRAGGPAAQAWADLFEGMIANKNTRRNYLRAVRLFLEWADSQGLELPRVMAADVGRYLSGLSGGPDKKKMALSGLRKFFRLQVQRHICLINPAAEAETVRRRVVEGRTPEITDAQFRAILAAIGTKTLTDLRDRLILTTLAYTGTRVGAVAALQRHHYYEAPDQWMLHFDEKGGKSREIPVAHDLKVLFDEYLERSGIQDEKRAKNPLTGEWEPVYIFRTAEGKSGRLKTNAMNGGDIYWMMRRHAKRAGIRVRVTPHSFRVAVATDLHEQGVPTDEIQTLLGHSEIRSTNLYKRNRRGVTRNLVERIRLGR